MVDSSIRLNCRRSFSLAVTSSSSESFKDFCFAQSALCLQVKK